MNVLNKIRHTLFFVFLGAIILCLFYYSVFGKEITIEEVRLYTESVGLWLSISFILVYTILAIFLPTTPLMAIAGILFGFTHGLIYTTSGGFLSALITFYIARILGKDMVEKILHRRFFSKLEVYDEKITKRGMLTVIILRMTPIMPFNILNLLMGISRVRSIDYILGTVIGLAPSNALTVYFGKLIFQFVTGRVAAALLGLSLLAIPVGMAIIYRNKKKQENYL